MGGGGLYNLGLKEGELNRNGGGGGGGGYFN